MKHVVEVPPLPHYIMIDLEKNEWCALSDEEVPDAGRLVASFAGLGILSVEILPLTPPVPSALSLILRLMLEGRTSSGGPSFEC